LKSSLPLRSLKKWTAFGRATTRFHDGLWEARPAPNFDINPAR
jgi:hypothetical protein